MMFYLGVVRLTVVQFQLRLNWLHFYAENKTASKVSRLFKNKILQKDLRMFRSSVFA